LTNTQSFYIIEAQKNNTDQFGSLSAASACRKGRRDKEIAVQIRGNSHYRNSLFLSQVGMLIGSCRWKALGQGRAQPIRKGTHFCVSAFGMAGCRKRSMALRGERFCFILLERKKGKDKKQ